MLQFADLNKKGLPIVEIPGSEFVQGPPSTTAATLRRRGRHREEKKQTKTKKNPSSGLAADA